MVGAITLYDKTGERLGIIYAATAPPEDKSQGKAAFRSTMEKEVAAVKARYPDAVHTGLSDGASDLLPWLREHASRQVLDFYHACGCLHAAAGAFIHEVQAGEDPGWWSHEACRHLKEDGGAAAALLAEMERRLASARPLRKPSPTSATTWSAWTTRPARRADCPSAAESPRPAASCWSKNGSAVRA